MAAMVYALEYSPFKKLTPSQYKKGIPDLDSYTGIEGLLQSVRPKDREAIRTVLTYDPSDIFMDIMYYAGIGTSNGIVIDNDTMRPLPYNGSKFMRFPAVVSNNKDVNIVNFDPIFNLKMMEIVFTVYISKISVERNLSVKSFFIYGRQNQPKSAELCFDDYKGTRLTSDQFMTDTVCYINLMMQIEGIDRVTAYNQCVALDNYVVCSKKMKGRHYE